MAVPNEDNFSLQDVRDEIEGNGGATSIGLLECFANAKSQGFDNRYKGSKTELLNFRNYQHVTNILNLFVATTNVFHQDHYDKYKSFAIDNFSATNNLTIKYHIYLYNFASNETVTINPSFAEHQSITLSTSNTTETVSFPFNPSFADSTFRAEISSNVNFNQAHGVSQENYKGYRVTMTVLSSDIDGIPARDFVQVQEGTIPG